MSPISIAGIMVVIADLYAIARTLRSDCGAASKARWIAIVLLVPILGVVLWSMFGPS